MSDSIRFLVLSVSLVVVVGCSSKPRDDSGLSGRSMGRSVLDVGPSSYDARRSSSPSAFDSSLNSSNSGTFGNAPVVASAPMTPEPATAARSHTIVRGDTLWSISSKYYGDGKKYRDILIANPGLTESKLSVGKTIMIP